MIAIIRNFEEVIKHKDINRINKELYEFLHLNCGFIAHYDINGFKASYRSPRDFAEVFNSTSTGTTGITAEPTAASKNPTRTPD